MARPAVITWKIRENVRPGDTIVFRDLVHGGESTATAVEIENLGIRWKRIIARYRGRASTTTGFATWGTIVAYSPSIDRPEEPARQRQNGHYSGNIFVNREKRRIE
jgi:hypothetical protein